MMKYINEEGQIVNAKEGIRLDANHDLYKDSETGEFLIVKRFYIYNKEDINIPAIKKYMVFDRNGKLIEGNMYTDEAQTKLKRCTVSAKVLKSVDFYGKRY